MRNNARIEIRNILDIDSRATSGKLSASIPLYVALQHQQQQKEGDNGFIPRRLRHYVMLLLNGVMRISCMHQIPDSRVIKARQQTALPGHASCIVDAETGERARFVVTGH